MQELHFKMIRLKELTKYTEKIRLGMPLDMQNKLKEVVESIERIQLEVKEEIISMIFLKLEESMNVT